MLLRCAALPFYTIGQTVSCIFTVGQTLSCIFTVGWTAPCIFMVGQTLLDFHSGSDCVLHFHGGSDYCVLPRDPLACSAAHGAPPARLSLQLDEFKLDLGQLDIGEIQRCDIGFASKQTAAGKIGGMLGSSWFLTSVEVRVITDWGHKRKQLVPGQRGGIDKGKT